MKGLLRALVLATFAGMLLSGWIGDTTELQGAGATFPAPIYARWRALFHRSNPEVVIHYRAAGSGRGIKAITAREVDFGASDALPTKSEQRALPAPLLSIPTVLGPVVIAYNLPDLETELALSGDVIAGIYLGEITAGDDPRIAAINAGVVLPNHSIRVAHRSDSSGTTQIFTDYLSAVSDEWREDVGRGKQVFWPTGDDWAGEGNDGVAHRILLEPGTAKALIAFLQWILDEGQTEAPKLHYTPLPDSLRRQARKDVSEIILPVGATGEP
jgi:phosphate transport system substrate-binding protein